MFAMKLLHQSYGDVDVFAVVITDFGLKCVTHRTREMIVARSSFADRGNADIFHY